MGTEDHPLFLREGVQFVDSPEAKKKQDVPVGKCRVSDFKAGFVTITSTPHYFYARDIVRGLPANSSRTFYRRYRADQFDFSQRDSEVDADFFESKIKKPDFEIPVTGYFFLGIFWITDGFHRLAIARAHGRDTVKADVESVPRSIIQTWIRHCAVALRKHP